MNQQAPVFLIHGMWSTPDTMEELRKAFVAQGYEVHVPRLPLHLPKNQLTPVLRKQLAQLGIEDYVGALLDDIFRVMKDKPDQKPILVGHSMGGLLAQLVAAEIECEQLVLLSSAAPAGINATSWSVLKTFGHNLFKFPLWRSFTNLLLRNIQYGIANSQSAQIQQDLVRDSTFESGRVTTQMSMWFLFLHPPTRVDVKKINCPVLIIGGSEDKITPIKIQHKIAKRFGQKASLRVIPGACHYTVAGSFFEQIKEHIFSWLNNQSAPQGSQRAA